jgi:hypothetical protein
MQEEFAVNDKNNANSRTKQFSSPEIQIWYLPHAKKLHYTTLHYTTQFSGKNGWRQASRQMEKWITEATMEDKTDKEVT